MKSFGKQRRDSVINESKRCNKVKVRCTLTRNIAEKLGNEVESNSQVFELAILKKECFRCLFLTFLLVASVTVWDVDCDHDQIALSCKRSYLIFMKVVDEVLDDFMPQLRAGYEYSCSDKTVISSGRVFIRLSNISGNKRSVHGCKRLRTHSRIWFHSYFSVDN